MTTYILVGLGILTTAAIVVVAYLVTSAKKLVTDTFNSTLTTVRDTITAHNLRVANLEKRVAIVEAFILKKVIRGDTLEPDVVLDELIDSNKIELNEENPDANE